MWGVSLLWLPTEWQRLGQFELFPNSSEPANHPGPHTPPAPPSQPGKRSRRLARAVPPSLWQRPNAWPCLLLLTHGKDQNEEVSKRERDLQWELNWPAQNLEAERDEKIKMVVNIGATWG